MKCPRRAEGPNFLGDSEDKYRADDTCSYCGSLNPDNFMARLEAGDIEVGPTDKSYKVYIKNIGGAPLKQTYRKDCDCDFKGVPPESIRAKVEACPHWVIEDRQHGKFYFQHLSVEQKNRFIELHNEKKMKIGYPGYFYVLPYFASGK